MALSFSAFAREIGVSQPYVSKLVKQGRIPVTADGKIDPELGRAALRRNTVREVDVPPPPKVGLPTGDAPGGETGGSSYNDAKRRDAMAVAALRELELAQRMGQLIERAPATKAGEDAGIALGKECEAAANRLAPAVFGAESVAKAREMIVAELNRMREVFTDTLEALAAARGATRQ